MNRPYAVLISGAPATGKTTLAAALAPRLGAAVIDIDVATGPLAAVVSGLIGVADLSDARIAELTRAPRYDTLLALAADNLRAGRPVILVAPFTAERSIAGFNAVANRLATGLALVWLHVPPDHLVDRLKRRGAVRDTAKTRDPSTFLATVDRRPPEARHLALDSTMPVPSLVEQVLVYLAHHGLAIDGNA